MKYLDLTFAEPAANLACDEALLDYCELQDAGEVLRVWEPADYFVVVGYSNKAAVEVDLAACAAQNVPVYRRFSGGGAVLQGPGCLNYSLVIKTEPMRYAFNIVESFKTVLKPHQELFTELMSEPVQIGGISDLAIGEKKFSGNSQHRKSHYTLFHGTFLLKLDLSMIQETLRMPSKEPGYRQHRPHTEFLRNLAIDPERVRLGLKEKWNAEEPFCCLPSEKIEQAVRERYAQPAWNFKF
jgi:lipoate---protein ligase